MLTDLGLCRKKLQDTEAETERCRKIIAAIRQWRHPMLVEVSALSAQIIGSGDIDALRARIAELEGWVEDQEDEIEWRRRWMKTTRLELKNHRKDVVAAVHQGIAGATRAWKEKVDEADLMRSVAVIDRGGAMSMYATAEEQRLEQAGIINDLNAKLAESNVILRAFAEAERLEDIALSSQGEPDARKKWAAWQAQRVIASEVLRAWQKRNPQPA